MKITFTDITLLLAALTTALSGGVFFAWAATVVPGLAKIGDGHYLAAMQSMNREIQNPVFFLCFFGAAILLPVCTYQSYNPSLASFWLLLSATAVYLIGVIGITMVVNVPLNNMLDAADLASANLRQLRDAFEPRWNWWNNVRAVASVISIALVLLALFLRKAI